MFEKLFKMLHLPTGTENSFGIEKVRKQFWDLKNTCTKADWKWITSWGKKNIVNHGEEPIPIKLFEIMRSILIYIPDEYFKVLEMDIVPNTNGTLGLVLSDRNKSYPKDYLDLIVTKGCEILYVISKVKDDRKDATSGTILMTTDYMDKIKQLIDEKFEGILPEQS